MVNEFNLTLTSVCAHANLLDPTSPDRYGTAEIIKAIKLAHFLGVKQVITTEGDPKTDFGHHLTVLAIQSGKEVVWDPAAYRIVSAAAFDAARTCEIRGDWMKG